MARGGAEEGKKWIGSSSCKLYHLRPAAGKAKIPRDLSGRTNTMPSFFSNSCDVAVILIKQWKIRPHAWKQNHLWLQSGLHFHPLELSQHQAFPLLKEKKVICKYYSQAAAGRDKWVNSQLAPRFPIILSTSAHFKVGPIWPCKFPPTSPQGPWGYPPSLQFSFHLSPFLMHIALYKSFTLKKVQKVGCVCQIVYREGTFLSKGSTAGTIHIKLEANSWGYKDCCLEHPLNFLKINFCYS